MSGGKIWWNKCFQKGSSLRCCLKILCVTCLTGPLISLSDEKSSVGMQLLPAFHVKEAAALSNGILFVVVNLLLFTVNNSSVNTDHNCSFMGWGRRAFWQEERVVLCIPVEVTTSFCSSLGTFLTNSACLGKHNICEREKWYLSALSFCIGD